MDQIIALDEPVQEKETQITGPRWYVIQSKNHKQTQARFYLERYGYRVFYPRYREAEVSGQFGRKIMAETPLFGNYMFLYADLGSAVDYQNVKNCHGVSHILGGVEPKVVPDKVIAILLQLGENGVLDRVQAIGSLIKYGRDEQLLITEGPFAGYVGKCIQSRGERIALFLSILGGEKRVTVRHDQVRRAVAPSETLSGTSGAARRRIRKTERELQREAGYDAVVKGSYATA